MIDVNKSPSQLTLTQAIKVYRERDNTFIKGFLPKQTQRLNCIFSVEINRSYFNTQG